ncbi:DUF4350 domain-containing protein [Rathayibacter sp. YIM 133350]|uniref:DUF4350 domain-containing protein n=1 Tax=Rathayibacter sp. YIM 133350 TaxID=3131992 RepID=UPI00307F6C94
MSAATLQTPLVRESLRRSRFWVLAALITLAVVVCLVIIRGSGAVGGTPLAADNPGPAGSQALVDVLKQQGVAVTVAHSLGAAEQALDTDSTLFLTDPQGLLSAGQLRRLAASAEAIVMAEPSFDALKALAPAVRHGGRPSGQTATAQCDVPAATRAGRISTSEATLGATSADWTGCFPAGKHRFSLVQGDRQGAQLTLLASGAPLRNDTIGQQGNAALALGLLGSRDHLVWYLPSLPDVVAGERSPTIAELTPDWVTPVLALLVVVTIAAGVWRGRRLGPLVIENLPVTVPAAETMQGRARLYARTNARLRALDALRIGAIGRLGSALRLPTSSSADDVAAAVAVLTGRPAASVRGLLIDQVPASDRDLVDLAAALDELEARVRDAARPQ